MAKVRVVVAELEGSDEAVLEVVRAFVGSDRLPSKGIIGSGIAPAVVEQSLAIAPAAAVEEPETQTRAKPGRKPKTVEEKAAESGDPEKGCRGAVAAQLKHGPASSGELINAVQDRYTSASVYLALKDLRGAGLVVTRKDPRDGETRNFWQT